MSRDPKRTLSQRTRDMLDAVTEIRTFVTGLDAASFAADTKTFKAVLANFTILGEAASHVPHHIQINYPQVPWPKITGLRNIVVHVYFGVERQIVWDTILNDFDDLEKQLGRMLSDFEGAN